MADYQNDIRQLLSYSVLHQSGRLGEADVRFTFSPIDLYLSAFFQATENGNGKVSQGPNEDLRVAAQIFEKLAIIGDPSIDTATSKVLSAAAYYLGGYSANSVVMMRDLRLSEIADHSLREIVSLLKWAFIRSDASSLSATLESLRDYLLGGSTAELETAIETANEAATSALEGDNPKAFMVFHFLARLVGHYGANSLWAHVQSNSSAPQTMWQQYLRFQLETPFPMLDLWPSQRSAIDNGLLSETSSMVIRTPTSSGKTKLTELIFVNELGTSENGKCLYLAPYRALVGEVEQSLAGALQRFSCPVASLYGGGDANELEAELTEKARVVIATPEKMMAVLALSGQSLNQFSLIVLDEGHIIDAQNRGATIEGLIAAALRQSKRPRIIFLSAVLPNAEDIAGWIGSGPESLISSDWQPTTTRIGVVRWPKTASMRINYRRESSQPLLEKFYVPRVAEQDQWQEINEITGRLNTHRWPVRGENGTIAAELAFQRSAFGPIIIYARRPDWANGIAGRILDRITRKRPITTNLLNNDNRSQLSEVGEYIGSVLGSESLVAQGLINGFGLHHSGVPQHIRQIIEDEFRNQNLRLLIATNTIAQGVNFPARTVIVHSLPDTGASRRDFWNLIGRAGRALRETEGEVLILGTGSLDSRRLRRFLDTALTEPAESRLLWLVREIIKRYPSINQTALDDMLYGDESDSVSDVIRAIDSAILENMAEDLAGVGEQGLDTLVDTFLAAQQARKIDRDNDTQYVQGLRSLFQLRLRHLSERIDSSEKRILVATTGLSVDSSLEMIERIDEVIIILFESAALSTEVLIQLFSKISQLSEFSRITESQLAEVASTWMKYGSYTKVQHHHKSVVGDIDNCVRFVDQEIAFRLPWILNGLSRVVEARLKALGSSPDMLPVWFRRLAGYLRYGVDSEPILWIMSLGIESRPFADALLGIYQNEVGYEPGGFRAFPLWALDNLPALIRSVQSEWPRYFVEQIEKAIQRFAELIALLET